MLSRTVQRPHSFYELDEVFFFPFFSWRSLPFHSDVHEGRFLLIEDEVLPLAAADGRDLLPSLSSQRVTRFLFFWLNHARFTLD